MKKLLLFFLPFCYMHIALSQKIALISIPKCGTHLLMNCIEYITQSNGVDWPNKQFQLTLQEINNMKTNIFAGHFLYNASNKFLIEQNNFSVILIIRDPRDQCVSMMHWLRTHPMTCALVQSMDNNTLLTQLIENHTGMYPPKITTEYPEFLQSNSIFDFYNYFLPWMQQPYVCTIKFESLIGKKGSGTTKEQEQAITQILNHLHIHSYIKVQSIAHYIYGHSRTFRKGKIGSWKEHFTQNHKMLFKKIAGQLLIDLNYEKDFAW